MHVGIIYLCMGVYLSRGYSVLMDHQLFYMSINVIVCFVLFMNWPYSILPTHCGDTETHEESVKEGMK